MAQDFWASSGFRLLEPTPEGLRPTARWIGAFLRREELLPPPDAGKCEIALHDRLAQEPLAQVPERELAAIEDPDARDNWRQFLRFRERLLAFDTLEACYRDLFARAAVDLAPPFVDALAQAIVRGVLEGSADAWLCRAGELFFRPQRVATEDARVLSADAATIEVYAETGGFGGLGRLLRRQGTPVADVKMDVLGAENAGFYFLRDELYSFVLDLSPSGQGAGALARVLERWVGHMAGVPVAIEPLARVDDARWRWHVGLDVESTAILNALYRGEEIAPARMERLLLLFRLEFEDPGDALSELGGRPVYLGLACREDRMLRMKPQNLLAGLPVKSRFETRSGS